MVHPALIPDVQPRVAVIVARLLHLQNAPVLVVAISSPSPPWE
jgi:hypothetical protein